MENPQAFPSQWTDVNVHVQCTDGMTLLDYFAGRALIGVLKQVTEYCETRNQWPLDWRDGVASDCYKIAQAMLKQREKIMKGN